LCDSLAWTRVSDDVAARCSFRLQGVGPEAPGEILGQARQRQLEAFTDLLRVRPEEPYPTTLSHAWSAMT
jgi:hypothetical protein